MAPSDVVVDPLCASHINGTFCVNTTKRLSVLNQKQLRKVVPDRSFANNTDRPRRALVLNVVKDGVRSDVDEVLLDGTDIIAKGQPLGGTFYPLLS